MGIKRGKIKDIESIWELEKESRIYHKKIISGKYHELNKTGINNKSKKEWINELKKDLKKKKYFLLISEDNNKVIGYLLGQFSKWEWSDNHPKNGKIEDIAVLKKYRRKGIGDKLIKKFEGMAKKRGIKYLNLGLWIKNKPAYNLYKKNKFDEIYISMAKKI